MNIIEKVKGLPTPLFILHFSSKMLFAFGLGILLASRLQGAGWWIIGISIVLSMPSAIKILVK
jgi:hypothetical protein